jgi:hypothetical protein
LLSKRCVDRFAGFRGTKRISQVDTNDAELSAPVVGFGSSSMLLHRTTRRVGSENSWCVADAFASSQQREYNESRDRDGLQDHRDDQSATAYSAFVPLLIGVAFDETAFQ